MMPSIAIGGPAGAGKSTIAKRVASSLGIHYLNTGAMYRALALFALRNGVDVGNEAAVGALLDRANITVFYEGEEQHTVLNGEDVTSLLGSEEISMGASTGSKYPAVRDCMAALQRSAALKTTLVLEGRDIGTNVLKDTPYKFFVTASAEERAQRRLKQLTQAGKAASYQDILADIKKRDLQDSQRSYMPLRQAEDAIVVDTTHMTVDEAVNTIINAIRVN